MTKMNLKKILLSRIIILAVILIVLTSISAYNVYKQRTAAAVTQEEYGLLEEAGGGKIKCLTYV